MRNFFKTTAGRGIMYGLFTISVIGIVLSIFVSILANQAELYSKPYDEVYTQMQRNELEATMISYAESYFSDVYSPRTNFIPMAIVDSEGNILKSDYDGRDLSVAEVFTYNVHKVTYDDPEMKDFVMYHDYFESIENPEDATITDYKVIAYLLPGEYINSEFFFVTEAMKFVDSLKYSVYAIGLVSLILAIISFAVLVSSAGKKAGVEGLVPGYFTKLPLELSILLAGGVIAGLCGIEVILLDNPYFMDYFPALLAASVLLCAGCALCFMGLAMTIATRIKLHMLIKTTFIYMLFSWLIKPVISLFKNIRILWKAVIILGALVFLELMVLLGAWGEADVLLSFWFIKYLILVPAILYFCLGLDKLKKAGEAIASGDMDHIDTKGLKLDLKKHAENLNSISDGMSRAVDAKMKSERMKTELITNVSHDIKTPLTSIINYAGLIAAEPCDNKNITEYSEVLVRQSEKLKRLIEDLVEASKAGTGNLEVNLEDLDANMLIMQATGEYEAKMETASLQLICSGPDSPVMISADPRRMWRVFDNLMNNICKYSMPGSRIYLSLEQKGSDAVVTFKNTSRDELNITPDELMERFVRGDKSRNTEGNGLGLSIARSLTELQGGKMALEIDGDLFKAILIFPVKS